METKILKLISRPLFLSIMLGSIVFFSACEKTDRATSDLSGTYKIMLDQTIDLPKEGKKARLTFSKFVDERCPPNANCVRSGPAIATLVFADSKINESFQLCFIGCDDMAKTITSNGIKYRIKLAEAPPAIPWDYFTLTTPTILTILIERV
jgi:hypothetical protein